MNKAKALIMLIALVFLGFVGYNRFSLPLDSYMLSPDSFYRGEKGSNLSPKEYYNQLHGLVYTNDSTKACKISVVHAENPVSIGEGGTVMFCSGKTQQDADTAGGWDKLIGPEGVGLFKDGDKIIKPNSGGDVDGNSFKNSNMQNSSFKETYDGIDIEVFAGDQVVIIFEDVKCWWCHAHNPESASEGHTEPIGNHSRSKRATVFSGDEIGVAKDTTRVKVYKVPDELAKDGKTVFDLTLEQLQQVHTGKYFGSGTFEVYTPTN